MKLLDIEDILSAVDCKISEPLSFEPSIVDLNEGFVATPKVDDELENTAAIEEGSLGIKPSRISPVDTANLQVIAIDSSNVTLGKLPGGLVGAVRVSVVVRPAGEAEPYLELYGPIPLPFTNKNKDMIYEALYETVHQKRFSGYPPDLTTILSLTRALIERAIQLKVARKYKNSLILLDGSLQTGMAADPESTMQRLIDNAISNKNTLAAISKSTKLLIEETKDSILSLLDGTEGACFAGGIKECIDKRTYLYLGEVYVARLAPYGHVFRVDIPSLIPPPHGHIFSQLASLVSIDGYPEELRLAHMTCILSCVEILELQAAAMQLYGLTLDENIRDDLFLF